MQISAGCSDMQGIGDDGDSSRDFAVNNVPKILEDNENGGSQIDIPSDEETLEWDVVLGVIEKHCLNCHVDEDFELQATWDSKKELFKTYVSLDENGRALMPPNAENFSELERNILLKWLNRDLTKGESSKTGSIDNNGFNSVIYEFQLVNLAKKTKDYLSSGKILAQSSNGSLLAIDFEGGTSTIDLETGAHGNEVVNESAKEYDIFYNVLSDGWIGIQVNTGSIVTFFSKTDSVYERFELSNVIAGRDIVDVSTKGFIYAQNNQHTVVRVSNGSVKSHTLSNLPDDFRQIGFCYSGCDLWGFTGSNLYYGIRSKDSPKYQWNSVSARFIGLEFAENRLLMQVEIDDNRLVKKDAFTYKDGNLYAAYLDTFSTPKEVTWEYSLQLAEKYCVPCHGTDGYDREEVWLSDKTKILSRLETNDAASIMPPKNTSYASQFSINKRQYLIDYLNSVGSKDTEIPPADPSSVVLVTPISGDLKIAFDNHCISCHFEEANFSSLEWWTDNRNLMVDIISSGEMPKNSTLTQTQKNSFINNIPQPNAVETPITGSLKEIADQYCISCHSVGNNLSWWTQLKSDINQRVNSGDMPRGGAVLSEEQKSALINAIP